MSYAVIAWGSLVWDPRDLPINSQWFVDGPLLPIEFARESADGRITLVITEGAKKCSSLWSVLDVKSIEEARQCLARREGISSKNIKYSIGFYDSISGKSGGKMSNEIAEWCKNAGHDGVVWTNLKCGFRSARDAMPSLSDLKRHLSALDPYQFSSASEYIHKTPKQVDTKFRHDLENYLKAL